MIAFASPEPGQGALQESRRAIAPAVVKVHSSMAVRRLKTYAAESGHVYEYYFVGKRPAIAKDPYAPATEYVFDVTTGRSPRYAVSVFLRDEAPEAWARRHGRSLADAEQYAAAKLRLLLGFDEVDNLVLGERRLAVTSDNIEAVLESLHLPD